MFSPIERLPEHRLVWPGILWLALVPWASPALAQDVIDTYRARVTSVFDGDTVWVRPADGGRSRKLRIDGIDSPEICQTGGRPARDALRERLKNQTVWVHERARDVYGRPLATLTLDGENMAAWMVKQGWAWSYRWHGDPGPFAQEETSARAKNKGIFGDALAEEPRLFRHRNGPCQRR